MKMIPRCDVRTHGIWIYGSVDDRTEEIRDIHDASPIVDDTKVYMGIWTGPEYNFYPGTYLLLAFDEDRCYIIEMENLSYRDLAEELYRTGLSPVKILEVVEL